ncbi:glutathione peroxidase [Gloeobacter morelensis]|uniref:Glutathione peroxidase n=1 Tax=Gloeobacter morelensis MG652769 TaxID=2781736 RepID=A0ABY3PKN0_9CYAN|nr:glutathione peroxidase [Gloeobacter morelensis]UFP94184.1 glutathione peroxidase [Gloeobacter morelensis MG652769]
MATVSDITVQTMDGQARSLGEYRGHVLLIVNVASYCGYTPQYAGLERLYRRYKDAGLRLLAFPCNDFGGQEPGSNAEIVQFCSRYDVSFELFDKVGARGYYKHPLYVRLSEAVEPAGDVSWNFEKFLIARSGEVMGRYRSGIGPEDPQLVGDIERELAKS